MTEATPLKAAGWLDRTRAFFDLPIRYAWVTLLVPTLASLKFAFGWFPNPHYPDYPAAWIMFFVPFAAMIIPLELTYAHLPARWRPADALSLRAVPFHAAIIVGWALVGLGLAAPLVSPLAPPEQIDPTHEWSEIPRLAFLFALVGAPIFLRGVAYRDRMAASRARELRAERELLAAQVRALQARIQPHFLFNSLNSIASLIGEDAGRAERAVEKLADVFRYALDASDRVLVPLADEIESAEGYLELEMLRLADRLRVSWHTEPGVGEVSVPPLLLQPLVENAVRHGISSRAEGGRVEVDVRREGDCLRLQVEDDGPGPGGSAHRGAGSALADLQKRLRLIFDGRAAVEIDRGPRGGFRATVRVPLDSAHASVRADGA
jgi:signal transduction histidine kinase